MESVTRNSENLYKHSKRIFSRVRSNSSTLLSFLFFFRILKRTIEGCGIFRIRSLNVDEFARSLISNIPRYRYLSILSFETGQEAICVNNFRAEGEERERERRTRKMELAQEERRKRQEAGGWRLAAVA